MESELAQLRSEEYNLFVNNLRLDELSTNNTTNTATSIVSKCLPAIANVDALTVKSFNSKYEKKQAIKRWNKALNVINAASQFSRSYENARIKKAEEILQNPLSSQ